MFKSSVYVTALTIIGSLLGLLVQVLIARTYGLGPVVDAYFFSLSWPLLMAGIISTALSFVVLPQIAALSLEKAHNLGEVIWASFFGLMIIIVCLSPFAFCLTWLQIDLLNSNSVIRNSGNLYLLSGLSWISAWGLVLKNYVAAVLHGLKNHVLASALSLFPYMCMVISLLLANTTLGIAAPLVGMIVGLIFALAFGSYTIFRQLGFSCTWHNSSKEAIDFGLRLPKAGLALSCFSTYSAVDAYIAPMLGSGFLSIISLIQRFIIAIGNLVVSGFSSVVIHMFIELIKQGDYKIFWSRLITCSLGVFIGSLVCFSPLYIIPFELIPNLLNTQPPNNFDLVKIQFYVTTMIPGACGMLTSVVLMRILFCFENGRDVGVVIGLIWTSLYFIFASANISLGMSTLTYAYTYSWLIIIVILTASVLYVAKKTMKI